MDILILLLLWTIRAAAFFTAWPWDLSRRRGRAAGISAPFLGLLLYGAYETSVRARFPQSSVPIRVDLVPLLPLVSFLLAIGFLRLVLIVARRSMHLCGPMRVPQIAVTIPIGVLAYLWAWCRAHPLVTI